MTIDHLRQLEGEALVTAVGVLPDVVTAHVADEEATCSQRSAAATAVQLDGLGARIEQAKQRVGWTPRPGWRLIRSRGIRLCRVQR